MTEVKKNNTIKMDVWEWEMERVGFERKIEGRVGWLLIRVNDAENPPIRAFSCVAGWVQSRVL